VEANPVIPSKKLEQASISSPQKLIHINMATAIELEKELQGVGKSKAQAIVRYRAEHGPFAQIEDLQHVQGIGKALIERNREKIQL
tara:strand:- start:2416 stop:2673 length:258 start_codon:yes stop_codon:yes gene_type:complete